MAIYKKLDGVSVFTGLVVPAGGDISKTRRLDDHTGPLDGPGHQVEMGEFAAHMSMYDDSKFPRVQTPLEGLIDMENPMALEAQKRICLARGWQFDADTVFGPFARRVDGSLDAHVRAGDEVLVVIHGTAHVSKRDIRPVFERFWCTVNAVLLNGTVVALPNSTLKWFPVGPYFGPVFFPATRILAHNKGMYW